jgi:hypothetical protein
LPEDA